MSTIIKPKRKYWDTNWVSNRRLDGPCIHYPSTVWRRLMLRNSDLKPDNPKKQVISSANTLTNTSVYKIHGYTVFASNTSTASISAASSKVVVLNVMLCLIDLFWMFKLDARAVQCSLFSKLCHKDLKTKTKDLKFN